MNPDQSKSNERTNGQSPQPQPLLGFSYITRKVEKLTTALYMVTDILSDKEPLKWKAREAGVDLLSDITVASTASPGERMSTLRTALKKIERVVSFIDIAASSRMITEMNSGVLKKEYLLLKDNVEAEWANIHDRSRQMLTERFFDVPKDLPEQALSERASPQQKVSAPQDQAAPPMESRVAPLQQSMVRPTAPHQTFTPTPKPSIEQASVPKNSFVGTTPKPEQTFIPSQSFATRSTLIVDREIAAHARHDFGRDDRRKIILALLKQKPSVIVGDIAKSIPGVSEKTIQRELLAMVSENILIKRGERRWSTYSLRTD